MSAALIQGDARALPLADASVQCVVCSPPYWGLRDYGVDGQLGLEPTSELYVEHIVEVFREVRRVLRPDGTLWLNLGDSYGSRTDGSHGGWNGDSYDGGRNPQRTMNDGGDNPKLTSAMRAKNLLMMPHRVAIALQADGWWVRSDIVWSKPNPMPESITDRPTKAHEYVFLLAKSERYFYDADAIREPSGTPLDAPRGPKLYTDGGYHRNGEGLSTLGGGNAAGRNARSVWTIATQPYPGAHFATYPEKLVEPCILAGSSPKACGVCAAPWERVTELTPEYEAFKDSQGWQDGTDAPRLGSSVKRQAKQTHPPTVPPKNITTGWRSTCEHDDPSGSCLVLDPFNGSGTTGRVALRLGRRYVGVDISREYLAEQAAHRLGIPALVNLDIERRDVERQLRMPL